ncbi:MAG: hypothetical protein ACOCXA_00665 [Planctomycetota bacterium]
MKLAIIHYHLQAGGVTRVVANHLQALDSVLREPLDVLLLHCGNDQGFPDNLALEQVRYQHHALPELAYDSHHHHGPGDVRQALETALQEHGCTPDETVLHVHNHALGKNAAFTACIGDLARVGWRLLLQVHDFAEDFRPTEFMHLRQHFQLRHGSWYPQAEQVHYATLNNRDHNLLADAGVPEERLHLLPNPVLPMPRGDGDAGRAALAAHYGEEALRPEYILYPVRGIARKQVGEFCLYAALAHEERCYGISLAPANPWQRPSYDAWRDLARQCGLPCLFDTGATPGLSFADHLAAADHLLTTAVAEGFGMVFLESCLSGHLIFGRDLPEITVDFRSEGVQFPGLRQRLCIPISWVDRQLWQENLLDAYTRVLTSYQLEAPSRRQLQARCAQLVEDDCIDFASCSRRLQEQIVIMTTSDPARRAELQRLNPDPLQRHSSTNLHLITQNNRRTVMEVYSMQAIGEQLLTCYQRTLGSAVGAVQPLRRAATLLPGFLDLHRFAPVRIDHG